MSPAIQSVTAARTSQLQNFSSAQHRLSKTKPNETSGRSPSEAYGVALPTAARGYDAVPRPPPMPSPWKREATPSSVRSKSATVRSTATEYWRIRSSFSASSSLSWGSSAS